MQLKKFVSLLVALIVLSGLFAGCTPKSAEPANPTHEKKNAPSTY